MEYTDIKDLQVTVERIDKVSPAVNSIGFTFCWARIEVWTAIIGALSKRKALTTLKFDKCRIGDEGRNKKAELALSKLSQLTSLTISK